MLHLQPVQLDLVRLVLRLLLQSTRPGRQLVLLLPGLGARIKGQFGHWRDVVDHPEQLVQLPADRIQLPRVRRQVVAVTLARLSTVLQSHRKGQTEETFNTKGTYQRFYCTTK